MKAPKKTPDEPVGIVISGMSQPSQKTVFLAYEWSPPAEEEPKAA